MRIIRPHWPAPDNVVAFSTTRVGGYSKGVFRGLNVADHVGDASETVRLNRRALAAELPAGTAVQWLSQVHGCTVVRAGKNHKTPEADASWTDTPGVACAVMTADCLPVLLCSENGEKVAAAHAGWRGLAQGVLETSVAALAIEGPRLMAWLGPAIGPGSFEVGAEVREQFLANTQPSLQSSVLQCFKPLPTRPQFYLADLYGLARIRLNAAGVARIYGGGQCTFSDEGQFYSYRRGGETGRMATIIAKISTSRSQSPHLK